MIGADQLSLQDLMDPGSPTSIKSNLSMPGLKDKSKGIKKKEAVAS